MSAKLRGCAKVPYIFYGTLSLKIKNFDQQQDQNPVGRKKNKFCIKNFIIPLSSQHDSIARPGQH